MRVVVGRGGNLGWFAIQILDLGDDPRSENSHYMIMHKNAGIMPHWAAH